MGVGFGRCAYCCPGSGEDHMTKLEEYKNHGTTVGIAVSRGFYDDFQWICETPIRSTTVGGFKTELEAWEDAYETNKIVLPEFLE